MNGKVYDLLRKINDLKIEKFGVQRENRMFLKRLLLDDEFLDDFIQKSGGEEVVIQFLDEVYNNLKNIGDNLNELVEMCDKKDELKEILGSDIRSGIKEVEEKKDVLLDRLIKTEINEREEKRKKIDDEKASSDRYNNILNKIKNEG